MKRVLVAAAALLLCANAAHAQLSAAGARGGFSIDPDQFVLGGQLQVGPFSRAFTFDPSLELGFGDNITTVQMNFDFNYQFDVGERWNPYVGLGMGIAFYDLHNPHNDPYIDNGTDTEVGANIIGGLRFPLTEGSRLGPEMRIGIGDIPSFKLLAVWNFPM